MGVEIFKNMLGSTMQEIHGLKEGSEQVEFVSVEGSNFTFHHSQDCCETVEIVQVDGDMSDLIGSPLLVAEQVDSNDEPSPEGEPESYTWTFYKFATIKGSVTVRWLGTSNGYYSESVDYEETLTG